MNLSLNDCFMKIQCKTIIDDNFQKIYLWTTELSKIIEIDGKIQQCIRNYGTNIRTVMAVPENLPALL